MHFFRFLERSALLMIAVGVANHSARAVDITGAGATFPYPIYAKWAEAYKAKTGNNLNYQSIGSGGSGTTFIWVNYLSKVSPEWKDKVGEGTSVNWPAGVGGKGNEGVASYVQRIAGSIGYVEYAYAKQNKLAYALMQNRDGQFVVPEDDTFKAAAAGADWAKAPGMYLILTDQSGKQSWPITGASFILMHKVQEKPENGKEVLKFFDWSFRNGADMAEALDYVPMPDGVVKLIQSTWKSQVKDATGKPIY